MTSNRDRIINIRPGLWLGIFGMIWLHALPHLGVGLAGLATRNSPQSAIMYMRLQAAFSVILCVVGTWGVRGSSRIHMVMGMALNTPDNAVHTLWTVIGPVFAQQRCAIIGTLD